MKTIFNAFMLIVISASLISYVPVTPESPDQGNDINRFLGQWTIDIQGGSVGWIEIRQEDNFISGDVLWGGGSVLPVSNIFLASGDLLIIQRSNNVIRNPLLTAVVTDWLEIMKDGDNRIRGILLHPRGNGIGVDTTIFTGVKLPPVPPAPDLSKLKFGKTVSLFNGKDLTGWKLINPRLTNGFRVADGILVNDPVQTKGAPHITYGNLRTADVYGDFNIKLEVNVPAGSNSGVYLRGMYEVQVSDSYQKELDPHNMGALYSRIKPSVNAEKPAGEWQSLDITLCERHLTVILNGIKIIDNQPVYGPTGGAILSDVFSPGPIYLQGDHGKVAYRNIVLTPILK